MAGKTQTTVTTFVPKTDLGKRLWAIRERYVDSGAPLLDWAQLEKEVAARRGEKGTQGQ